MSSKITMTIMCGLPRCGKSTWIKRNKKDAVIVSPDEIRAKILGHQFHPEAEGFVWAIAESMASLLLDQGKSIIIDATNINFHSRGRWIKMAEKYNVKARIIWLKTSLKKCHDRNIKSEQGKKVPPEVISGMALNFQDPSIDLDKVDIIEIPKGRQKKHRDVFSNYYQKEVKQKMQEEQVNYD